MECLVVGVVGVCPKSSAAKRGPGSCVGWREFWMIGISFPVEFWQSECHLACNLDTMPPALIYLGRLAKKWMEMVTGGLIAVYLAIQPYTGWSAPHKWIFWSVIAAAWAIASYRVWLDSYG